MVKFTRNLLDFEMPAEALFDLSGVEGVAEERYELLPQRIGYSKPQSKK